jgi:hypothetical protein
MSVFPTARRRPISVAFRASTRPGKSPPHFPHPKASSRSNWASNTRENGLNLQFFPFYSLLQNVNVPAVFNYTSGPQTGQQYVEPAFQGQIKTFGIEISPLRSCHAQPEPAWQPDFQDPKASNFYNWAQGPKGDGTDDVKTLIPRGDADNNPKIILRGGFDYAPMADVKLFGTAICPIWASGRPMRPMPSICLPSPRWIWARLGTSQSISRRSST